MNSRKSHIIVSGLLLIVILAACAQSPAATPTPLQARQRWLPRPPSWSVRLPAGDALTLISRFPPGTTGPIPAPAALWELTPILGR